MPDKRDMHKAKSHRNSRGKNQANNHRGNPGSHADSREAGGGREASAGSMRPSGPARPGEPGAAAASGNPTVTATTPDTTGAPVPLNKKNRGRR